MKDLPKVGFICTGESALELSSAICCAGRLMRHFGENGYMTGGCYSCISPSKQTKMLRERISHMCACNDVVISIGCDGFRDGDVIPDIVSCIAHKDLPYFSYRLSADEYVDAESGKTHKCFPSRSVAAICGSTVVLTVPAELSSSLGKLNSLMPAIEFAVRNSSDKRPAKSMELGDLVADFYAERSFQD